MKLGVCCSFLWLLPCLSFSLNFLFTSSCSFFPLSPGHVTQKLHILQIDFKGFCCIESSEGTRAGKEPRCSCCPRLFHTAFLGALLGSHSECLYYGLHKGKRAQLSFFISLGTLVLAVRMMEVISLSIRGWTKWLLKLPLSPAYPGRQSMSRVGMSCSALYAFSFPSVSSFLLQVLWPHSGWEMHPQKMFLL